MSHRHRPRRHQHQHPTPAPEPTPTVAPVDDIATWSDVEPAPDQRPTITIDQAVYPDAEGVQFWLNGEIDERTSSRPGGFDATGPNEDSEYHMWPVLDLSDGDTIEAHWTDTTGVERSSSVIVVDSDPGPVLTPEDPEPTPAPPVDSPVVCEWDGNPNNPTDDPNPAWNGTFGRWPVSTSPGVTDTITGRAVGWDGSA